MSYLILAIGSSVLMSVGMRVAGTKVRGKAGMLTVNYLICLIIAVLFAGDCDFFPKQEGLGLTGFLGSVNGILYVSNFLLYQFNIRKNGVVLSTTFMKLGLLVPMVLSIFLFGEMPEWLQWLGFGLALIAILIINYEKDNTVVSSGFGLIAILLVGGVTDSMAKVYNFYANPALSEQFLLYTFSAAVIVCGIWTLLKKEKPGLREIGYGILIGVPNYFSARFLLKAVESLPAVIAYPTYSVGTIIVVTLAGLCIFREKLGRRQWIGLGVILVALVLLNL